MEVGGLGGFAQQQSETRERPQWQSEGELCMCGPLPAGVQREGGLQGQSRMCLLTGLG